MAQRSANGQFCNPWDTWKESNLLDVLRWQLQRRRQKLPAAGRLCAIAHPLPQDFAAAFPVHRLDLAALSSPPKAAVQAVWLGHATVLVQLDGLTLLTDPIFSERCSPVQFLGPRRVVPSPVKLGSDELPHIDAVLISHNHYDHLDAGTVAYLHRRYGAGLAWFVPLGLRRWFAGCGIAHAQELDWWQEAPLGPAGARVTFTPAQHWSSRTGMDRRASLWGGFAVRSGARSFYFAGDTGYCPAFAEIGARLGPFDMAAILVGAYAPRWFMAPQHVDPAEAVRIHGDVRAARSIGVHCCTFNLTDEPLDEPPRALAAAVAAAGLPRGTFTVLQHGAMLQTAGGVDLNAPPVLGAPAEEQPAG